MVNTATRFSVRYGGSEISCHLSFQPLKSRKVRIQVWPDRTVQVTAPHSTSLAEVKQAVLKRARWINTHLQQLSEQRAFLQPRDYVSGESHFYLGRRFLLKVIQVAKKDESVRLVCGQLQVRTQNVHKTHVRGLLETWYVEHAHHQFGQRLDKFVASISWLPRKPEWRLRSMKKRWGSCSSKGVMLLNPHLIKASGACIDYVILHELCHLKVHNHSADFYRLLDRTLPGWRDIKTRLDVSAEMLLNV